MIEKISDYIEPIILLLVAITVVELILPDGKNKKYVMLVSSIIIMISVINPILKAFNSGIDFSETVDKIQKTMNEAEYNSSTNYELDYNIYNSYIENLKRNMIIRMEEMGYKVLKVKINVDKNTYEPEEIEMKVEYEDGYVQPIVIDVFETAKQSKIKESDILKIKNDLSSSYGVEKNKIKINWNS